MRDRHPTPIALLALFLSGAAGLIYEVCWIRHAALAFGSTTAAVTTVVAVFFLGLAAGSHVFGRVSAGTSHPLRLYAFLEIALAALAAGTLHAFGVTESWYGAAYRAFAGQGGWLVVVRAMIIGAVIFAPAFAMGGTLPLFSRWYVRRDDAVSRGVGWIYAVNTTGAACGALATGYLFLPAVGLRASLLVGVALSVAAALLVFRLGVAGEPLAAPAKRVEGRPAEAPGLTLAALFFLVGFVALAAEVLWARFLGLFVHVEAHTYSLTLGVVLAGIVLGSLLASRWFDRSALRGRHLGGIQVLTGLSMLTLTMLPASRTEALRGSDALLFLAILVPSALSGAAFPLAVRMWTSRAAGVGPATGTMLAVNTLGGILGALVAGFVMLPHFGLETGIRVTTGLSLLGGFLAWMRLDPKLGWPRRGMLMAVSAGLWFAVPAVSGARLPVDMLGERGRVIAHREGLTSNLAVIENDGVRQLEIDRWWQGEDRPNHQLVVAHLPMLLVEHARRVLVVGLGTGQTASRFLMHPITHLDCVDIEPALFDFVREHFEAGWMDEPRVRFIMGDGRDHIAHSGEFYDVISLEVGQVFRPGVAFLYTQEFYQQVRERLAPGGVVTQFVPMAFFTPAQFRSTVATFLAVFPQSQLWYNTAELLLLGFADGAPRTDPERIADRLAELPAVRQDLAYSHWGGEKRWLNDPSALLAAFLAGPKSLARLARDAGRYRDDRPVLDYAASGAWQRPTQESAIVATLRAHLDSLETILAPGVTWPAGRRDQVRAMRELNLGDIVAGQIMRRATGGRSRSEPAQAAALLEEAVRSNPESARARQLLGDALALTGRLDEAEREYREALRIRPADGRARHGLAVLLHQTARVERAIEHYRMAAQARPFDAEIQNNMGAALAQTGRFQEARSHFEEALRLAPGNQDALVNLARLPRAQ